MKKSLAILLLAMIGMSVIKAQSADDTYQFIGQIKEASSAESTNLLSQMMKDWPLDSRNDEEAALVRISFVDVPMADAKAFNYTASSPGQIVKTTDRLDEQINQYWIYLDPIGGFDLSLRSADGHLATYHVPDNSPLKSKGIYDVTVKGNKKVTINIEALPANAKVRLDNGILLPVNKPIENVSLGKHSITVSYDGQSITEEIEVSDTDTRFPADGTYYDLRPKRIVKISTDPKGADIYIDGNNRIGSSPVDVSLAYGPHTIVGKNPLLGLSDTLNIDLNANSPAEYKLHLVKKKAFEVRATYGGTPVAGSLYIDGKLQDNQPNGTYPLYLPIGKTYNMSMSYYGHQKKRKIRVTEDMDTRQVFKIAAKNSMVWWWQKDFDPAVGGISLGYVQKQYVTKGDGEVVKENIYGDMNSWMRGAQFGFYVTPAFQWGLGLYSGLFYELYYASDDSGDYDPYDSMLEHNLYLPVHLYYRIPFANKYHVAVHGGVGLDYVVAYQFMSNDDDYEDITSEIYGEEGWPKHFNMSFEVAVDLRFGPVMVSGTYSKGFINHKFYEGYKTVQNKLSLSVSYVFSSGD